jgi:cysteine synthase A
MLSKHFPLKELDRKLDHLWCLVGNTPMLEILYELDGQPHTIYAKCEHYNLTGSIKDRMALYILQKAYNEGKLQPGNKIVEATSGNTGISFSAIGRALGHPVTILMPDWLSRERRDIITSLGAEVILVSKNQGGFKGSIEMSEAMAEQDDNVFLPRQFENIYNAEAHSKTTANEIWLQLAETGCSPSAFVAGVGTGGTVMGIAQYLKSRDTSIRVHPLEPAESPTLSTGYKIGSHRIQGISDEFIPPIVQLGTLDAIISAHDGDAIIMAQQMSRQLGLAVGISSGANIAGAIKVKQQMAADAVVVTVLSDSNKKYLSTDLMKPEPVKQNYLSARVKFLDYKPLKRALR